LNSNSRSIEVKRHDDFLLGIVTNITTAGRVLTTSLHQLLMLDTTRRVR